MKGSITQTASGVVATLASLADSQKAKSSAWFFKTGKGQYAEGDKFIGVTVPEQRKVAKQFKELPAAEIEKLLQSDIHEHRLTALIMLRNRFNKGKAGWEVRKEIIDLYLHNLKYVNNWDLVDTSAAMLGEFLQGNERKLLYDMARCHDLWRQRIAIIATGYNIGQGDFEDTIAIAEILLHHPHDLIHKAVGWMLREVGKRDQQVEEEFLDKHHKEMPRTMLRYAIEKFPEAKRKHYMRRE